METRGEVEEEGGKRKRWGREEPKDVLVGQGGTPATGRWVACDWLARVPGKPVLVIDLLV